MGHDSLHNGVVTIKIAADKAMPAQHPPSTERNDFLIWQFILFSTKELFCISAACNTRQKLFSLEDYIKTDRQNWRNRNG